MDGLLAGETALVTGAAGGIGLVVARALAREGWLDLFDWFAPPDLAAMRPAASGGAS